MVCLTFFSKAGWFALPFFSKARWSVDLFFKGWVINCLFFQRLNGLCPVSQVKFLRTGVLFTQLVPQCKGLLLGQALLFTLLFDDLNYFLVLCRSAHTNFAYQPFLAFTFIASLQVCPGFWFVGIYKGDFFQNLLFAGLFSLLAAALFFKGSFFFLFPLHLSSPWLPAGCTWHHLFATGTWAWNCLLLPHLCYSFFPKGSQHNS